MTQQLPPQRDCAAACGGPASTLRVPLHRHARRVLAVAGGGALIVCVYGTMFFITGVVVQPDLSETTVGLPHSLLAIQACIAAAITGAMIYVSTRKTDRRLSDVAAGANRLLQACQDSRPPREFLENPNLVHCKNVFKCTQAGCPMYDLPGTRCWQLMALSRAEGRLPTRSVEIRQCQQCLVYRMSCPDRWMELSESLNNLIFLLDQEARHLARMRAQMVETEKTEVIGQMAAGVAHEVGNPLASISSVAQMLRGACTGKREKRETARGDIAKALDLIESNVQRIAKILRQLTRVARPFPDRREPVSVAEILEKTVDMIRLDERAQGIEISLEPCGSRLPTTALRVQLQEAFTNIALNALDAMTEGGSLTIRSLERHAEMVVTFEDSGCGIPAETGRRVFDPFFTTKEPGEGTGLGLFVSNSIVRKHGGTIDFRAGATEGTVFTVTLPILGKPSARPARRN